jgi:hypothetical protein
VLFEQGGVLREGVHPCQRPAVCVWLEHHPTLESCPAVLPLAFDAEVVVSSVMAAC